MNENLIEKIVLALRDSAYDNVTHHRNNLIYQAIAVANAIKTAGYAVVPAVPTNAILELAGSIEGFDNDKNRNADEYYINWYKTMIEAVGETDEQI